MPGDARQMEKLLTHSFESGLISALQMAYINNHPIIKDIVRINLLSCFRKSKILNTHIQMIQQI